MNITNGTVEFPLWRPFTAINFLLFIGVLLPITLITNISVFTALIKSKIRYKPLLVLFGSLLLGVCLDKLIIGIDQCANSVSTIRYCHCERWRKIPLQAPRIFFTGYSVVAVTCLSIMQLLVMRGKRNGYKQAFFCMIVSVLVALFWTVVFITTNGTTKYPVHCDSFCYGSNPAEERNIFSSVLLAIVLFVIFTLFPALIVSILSSVWTLQIFRKKFIVRSDNQSEIELNRRMLLLPLLMVILLFCNALLTYILSSLTGLLLKQAGVESFYGNWANIISKYEYFSLDVLHSLSYPLVLLFLYTNIWKTWKKLFLCSLCKIML